MPPTSWTTRAWPLATPPAALAVLAATALFSGQWWQLTLVGLALVAAVLASVHHAEVIAHKVGEPFGTLFLALAVTAIELALIVSLMLSGGNDAMTVARDTVYAAVLIVCNGVVGLCLLAGATRHHTVAFRVEGAMPTLSVLAALVVLTLVLPNFTTTTTGPTFSRSQLGFAGVVSLGLYCIYVFVQTVRHRDYFLPAGGEPESHAPPPSLGATLLSVGLLLASLVAVVGLAKALAPAIRGAIHSFGAPASAVGVAIAVLVLLPETGAALRAALANRMQTSLNLALGSGLATIGLTIPAVAGVAIALDLPLVLGLPMKETVLLALTLLVSAMSLGGGRATILQGCLHLALFAVFLFLAVVP